MADVQNQQTKQQETAQTNPDANTEGEGGEGEGSEPDVESLIREAVDKEVAGLRNKNHELLGKLKKQQEMLEPWRGLDPERVKGLMEQLDKDEELKLKAEGKVDELVERRVQDYVSRSNQKVSELDEQLNSTRAELEHWQSLYNTSVVKNFVANSVKGLEDGALPIVQDIVSKWLTVEDGTVITNENAPVWSKGKLRVDQIQDFLLEQNPFLFKPSQGGGAVVGKRSYSKFPPKSKMTAKDKAEFFAEARSRGLSPVEEYNKLPD